MCKEFPQNINKPGSTHEVRSGLICESTAFAKLSDSKKPLTVIARGFFYRMKPAAFRLVFQQGINARLHFSAHRVYAGAETADEVSFLIHQKFFEIPADVPL